MSNSEPFVLTPDTYHLLMSLLVKICGLCSETDVRAVTALRPDALGFVFWAGSKRAVKPADVAAWTRDLPAGLLKVGVFVDAGLEEIQQTVQSAGLDVVQWHGFQGLEKTARDFPSLGKNDAEFSKHWKKTGDGFPNLGKNDTTFSKVWKVVHLDRGAPSEEEAARVDAFLVDSYSADSPGGTGRVGDWATGS